jgi:hypothetical protein
MVNFAIAVTVQIVPITLNMRRIGQEPLNLVLIETR